MKENYIGKKSRLLNRIDVATEYARLAKNDWKAAELLHDNGLYNEAVYYYVQTMEKRIKEKICCIVDITDPDYSNRMRTFGDSLDGAIEFLIEILSGHDKIQHEKLTDEIVRGILQDINFSKLHNNVCNPAYDHHKKEYTSLEIPSEECTNIKEMAERLEAYLRGLNCCI
ncbi:MAG: hypothetical protein E7256_13955 [Lachnospiraceae bacterium]|nr:hypothetical protein [Lachnospiraceae bacterium]